MTVSVSDSALSLTVFSLRSSSSSAAQAFAAATAGSHNPRDGQCRETSSFSDSAGRKISLAHSAATMRVLSVLRHWITKHTQVSCDVPSLYQQARQDNNQNNTRTLKVPSSDISPRSSWRTSSAAPVCCRQNTRRPRSSCGS